jgi:hypothetical protein
MFKMFIFMMIGDIEHLVGGLVNGEMNNDELRTKLMEDMESAEEAEELLPVVAKLAVWQAPRPAAQETAQLIRRLELALPQEETAGPLQLRLQWAYWLLRAQARVVRHEIWSGSLFVMVLGVLVTLAADRAALPFVLIAPLVAAVGVAFLYGSGSEPALEIELATPVSPRFVLLARLSLLFGVDMLLGLAGSIILSLLRAEISLWPLMMAWLAPMAFLSALALLVSLLFFEPLLGVLVSMVLWSIQTVHQFPQSFTLPAYLPNLLAGEAQPWLWIGTAVLVALTLWLAGQEERFIVQRPTF